MPSAVVTDAEGAHHGARQIQNVVNRHDRLGWIHARSLAEDASLRATGTVVEVDHPTRGKYLSVGNPIKLSESPTKVERSPLLGEHTEEILAQVLRYSAEEIAQIKDSGAITPPAKKAAAE